MDRFELSERWAPWRDLDVIFSAARAAIDAGPLHPPLCEVVFNGRALPSSWTRRRSGSSDGRAGA